jgi:hypothetical protein
MGAFEFATASHIRLGGLRAGLLHFEAALNREHPNLILRTIPFAEAKSVSILQSISTTTPQHASRQFHK